MAGTPMTDSCDIGKSTDRQPAVLYCPTANVDSRRLIDTFKVRIEYWVLIQQHVGP